MLERPAGTAVTSPSKCSLAYGLCGEEVVADEGIGETIELVEAVDASDVVRRRGSGICRFRGAWVPDAVAGARRREGPACEI
jgi:hypothetical protein